MPDGLMPAYIVLTVRGGWRNPFRKYSLLKRSAGAYIESYKAFTRSGFQARQFFIDMGIPEDYIRAQTTIPAYARV